MNNIFKSNIRSNMLKIINNNENKSILISNINSNTLNLKVNNRKNIKHRIRKMT